MIPIDDATKARFWARADKTSSCWLWRSRFLPNGYGRYCVKRNCRRHDFIAHRFAWMITYGPIPQEMFVLHRCDNPACVRPEHLFLGTHADNMADMVAKGRSTRGERSASAILTEEQVRAIHAAYLDGETQHSLGRRFGVSHSQVGMILRGKVWAHLGLVIIDGESRKGHGNSRGENHGAAKLRDPDVLAIRAAHAAGQRVLALARQYGVSGGAISLIVHRKAWRHI